MQILEQKKYCRNGWYTIPFPDIKNECLNFEIVYFNQTMNDDDSWGDVVITGSNCIALTKIKLVDKTTKLIVDEANENTVNVWEYFKGLTALDYTITEPTDNVYDKEREFIESFLALNGLI